MGDMENNSLVGIRFVPAKDRRAHQRVGAQLIQGVLDIGDESSVTAHLIDVAMRRVERTRAQLATETAELEHLIRTVVIDGDGTV
jgi:hypothetical protein